MSYELQGKKAAGSTWCLHEDSSYSNNETSCAVLIAEWLSACQAASWYKRTWKVYFMLYFCVSLSHLPLVAGPCVWPWRVYKGDATWAVWLEQEDSLWPFASEYNWILWLSLQSLFWITCKNFWVLYFHLVLLNWFFSTLNCTGPGFIWI